MQPFRPAVPRRWLLAALATVLASPAVPWADRRGAPRHLRPERLLSDLGGARAIGRRYLALAPQEAAPGLLARCLDAETGAGACGEAGPERLRRALDEQRRRDFAAGDTVVIDGWILARTEARLCALAALG